MIATIWEVWNDRHGDLNKQYDVIARLILLWIEGAAIHFIFHRPLITSLMISTAIFFLLFDYVVTYVLIQNKVIEVPGAHWFSYTGKKGWFDNLGWWKHNAWIRLGIKLAYLIISLILFIKIS
jgi:hypothetical protein